MRLEKTNVRYSMFFMFHIMFFIFHIMLLMNTHLYLL
jgi:hypothetical protein